MSIVLSERVAKLATTKTGLKIGLAYEAPPAELSEDDEELQRALMYERSERSFSLITWAMALCFCAVFWLLVWGVL